MTSGEIPPGVSTKGVVLVAHGGQASSTAPTSPVQPAVLRMIPVAAAIRQGLRGSGAVVRLRSPLTSPPVSSKMMMPP